MKIIALDAQGWRTQDDFYDALLPAIGAPEWHGRNLDALWDSIVGGDINSVSPPFVVRVMNAPAGEVQSFLAKAERLFLDARADGIDVQLTLS